MRILMVTPGRLPVPAVKGGAVENLIELLLNYHENNPVAEITVVSVYEKDAVEKSGNYRNSEFCFFKRSKFAELIMQKHWLPYRFFNYCFSVKTGRFLKKHNQFFDVIVIQNELVNGRVFQHFLQGKYVYHAHNDTLEINNKKDASFLKSCDCVISISEYLTNCLLQKAGLSNTATVYNGIDLELFDRKQCILQRKELRKRFGVKVEDIVVVFAGRLVPEKGVQVLVEAISKIPEEYHVKLLVIGASFFKESGDNNFAKKLKEVSESIRERIIFSGYIDYKEMPAYYSMADVGCVPSLWEEPFGLTVVEQMAMELPVIATDSGAIPEIIDESNGYIIQRGEKLSDYIAQAIIELSVDFQKRRNMGLSGRNKAERLFNRQQFCEKWFRIVTGRSANESEMEKGMGEKTKW
ncbi:MAG: glycosyltransferase family 4 protein [Fusicatenibacter sp.]|nr:glycosyltransferase family 4 protein [Fusicatenibacter sp.]